MRFRGSRAELQAALAHLPAVLTGRAPDPSGAVEQLKIRMAMVLLARVKAAFVVKAGGGADEMGISWPSLAPATLALRRTNVGAKALQRANERYKTLPADQQKLLATHAASLSRAVTGKDRAARATALRILEKRNRLGLVSKAYYKVKKRLLTGQMNPTELALHIFVGKAAQILRDTGRMMNSLGPALGGDTILRTGPGWVEVGSNVEYFVFHQSARPRKLKKDGTPRLPRRQILPDNMAQVPRAWLDDMMRELQRGLKSQEFWRAFLGSKAG